MLLDLKAISLLYVSALLHVSCSVSHLWTVSCVSDEVARSLKLSPWNSMRWIWIIVRYVHLSNAPYVEKIVFTETLETQIHILPYTSSKHWNKSSALVMKILSTFGVNCAGFEMSRCQCQTPQRFSEVNRTFFMCCSFWNLMFWAMQKFNFIPIHSLGWQKFNCLHELTL